MTGKNVTRLLSGLLLAAMSFGAYAVAFGPGVNDIELINRENQYRPDASCTANGGCLGSGTGPSGYQLVNPAISNNVLVGDMFAGVFSSRTVTNQGLTGQPGLGTVWGFDNTAPSIDTFTGYFAQEVKQVQLNVSGPIDRITLGTLSGADPFGVLQAGEVARAYVDNSSLANTPYLLDNAANVAASIASVTDGSLWASLTVGANPGAGNPDTDGYVYSELDVGTPGNQLSNGNFYIAWDLGTKGPAYNAGTLVAINDSGETVYGGSQAGDPLTTILQNYTPFCPASATYACNDIVGNGQLAFNSGNPNSPWLFASEDPLQLVTVPEPGSLALFGLSLAILGFGFSRTRRQA